MNTHPNRQHSLPTYITFAFVFWWVLPGCSGNNDHPIIDMAQPSTDMADMIQLSEDMRVVDMSSDQGGSDLGDMSPEVMDLSEMGEAFVLSPEDQQKADTLREIFETRCELMAQCYPTIYERSYVGESEVCIEQLGNFSFLLREVEYLITDQEQLDMCLENWRNAKCIQAFQNTPLPACNFVGTKEAGEPCVNHIGCGSGFCGYFAATRKRFICEGKFCSPKINVGDPCPENGCPHDMKCVSQDTGPSSCQYRLDAGEGDCRGGTYFSLCQYGSYCDDETGVCVEQKSAGERCGSAGRCLIDNQLDCPINPDDVQGPRYCVHVPDEEWYLPEGSLCTNGSEELRCAKGTQCSSRRDCVKPSPIGSPCEGGGDCERTAFCNDDGVCQSERYEDVCL